MAALNWIAASQVAVAVETCPRKALRANRTRSSVALGFRCDAPALQVF